MFKWLALFLLIFSMTSCKAQVSTKESISFVDLYSDLSPNGKIAEFDNKSKEISFKNFSKNGDPVNYKLLANDIHPLGVFVLGESKNVVRILSIDNGKRFVRERVISGFRTSNNTNYIDLNFNSSKNINEVHKFVEALIDFLESKSQKMPTSDKIQTIAIPNKSKQ